jgi:hypothetical protein
MQGLKFKRPFGFKDVADIIKFKNAGYKLKKPESYLLPGLFFKSVVMLYGNVIS